MVSRSARAGGPSGARRRSRTRAATWWSSAACLRAAQVTLVSCYLADLAGPTGVPHLRLTPGRRPEIAQR
jgi:hypothetical protein